MSVPPPPFAAMPPHGLPDLIEHDACALAAFVTRDGKPFAIMQPEKRFYPVQQMPTTDVAIRTNGFADLYAVADGRRCLQVRGRCCACGTLRSLGPVAR